MPPIRPAFAPVLPLLLCLSLLFLFGLGFNRLVEWANSRRAWPVSFSVVIGVAVTLLVPTLFFWDLELYFWQSSVVYFLSFVASGSPMILGNVHRETRKHRALRLPPRASRMRDEVVMQLHDSIEKIVRKEAEVVDVVHTLHQVIGTLKSL